MKHNAHTFLLIITILITACGTPTPAATATLAPTRTLIPTTATKTPRPTATLKPSRTPKPSPTLPVAEVLNCIPLNGKRESGIVVRVIDGDTAEIKVGLLTYTVRYIGIDTPETKKEGVAVQPWGPEATARNRELVSGKRVTLIRDPKNDDQDIYGRLLRYIIVDDTFVNYQLVREGFAFLYISGHTCGPEFFNAYEAAQADEIGLFAPKN